jgi:hypothetical protein
VRQPRAAILPKRFEVKSRAYLALDTRKKPFNASSDFRKTTIHGACGNCVVNASNCSTSSGPANPVRRSFWTSSGENFRSCQQSVEPMVSHAASQADLDLGSPVMKNNLLMSAPKTPCWILFLHGEHNGYDLRSCDDISEAEDEIRYWLGKSPGIHKSEMEQILVFPKEQTIDHIGMIEKLYEEEAEAASKYQERQERELYERLKKKYSPESPQSV